MRVVCARAKRNVDRSTHSLGLWYSSARSLRFIFLTRSPVCREPYPPYPRGPCRLDPYSYCGSVRRPQRTPFAALPSTKRRQPARCCTFGDLIGGGTEAPISLVSTDLNLVFVVRNPQRAIR